MQRALGPVGLPDGVAIPYGYPETGAETCQFHWERVWGKLVPPLTSLWDAKRVLVGNGASFMCIYKHEHAQVIVQSLSHA